jgi:hypothetical protein
MSACQGGEIALYDEDDIEDLSDEFLNEVILIYGALTVIGVLVHSFIFRHYLPRYFVPKEFVTKEAIPVWYRGLGIRWIYYTWVDAKERQIVLLQKCGMDVIVYMRLCFMHLKIYLSFIPWAIVLGAIYGTRERSPECREICDGFLTVLNGTTYLECACTWVEILSVKNNPDFSTTLVLALGSFIFGLLALFVISVEVVDFVKFRSKNFDKEARPSLSTLLVTSIPKNENSIECIQKHFSMAQVVDIQLYDVKAIQELLPICKERHKILNKLEYYINYKPETAGEKIKELENKLSTLNNDYKEKLELISSKNPPSDGAENFEDPKFSYNLFSVQFSTLQKMTLFLKKENSNIAFITFKGPFEARKARQLYEYSINTTFKLTLAGEPTDMRWSHLYVPFPMKLMRNILAVVLALAVTIGVAFFMRYLAQIKTPEYWYTREKTCDEMVRIVQLLSFGVPLIVTTVMEGCYPIMLGLSKLTASVKETDVDTIFCSLYFVFLIIQVFYVFVIEQSDITNETLYDLRNNTCQAEENVPITTLFQNIGLTLPMTVSYFISYQVTRLFSALFTTMLRFSDLGKALLRFILFGFDYTKTDSYSRKLGLNSFFYPGHSRISKRLAKDSMQMYITMILCCMSPYILISAIIYQCVIYTFNMHAFLYVNTQRFDSTDGAGLFKIAFRVIVAAIFTVQIVTFVILISLGAGLLAIFHIIFMILTGLLTYRISKKIITLLEYLPLQDTNQSIDKNYKFIPYKYFMYGCILNQSIRDIEQENMDNTSYTTLLYRYLHPVFCEELEAKPIVYKEDENQFTLDPFQYYETSKKSTIHENLVKI